MHGNHVNTIGKEFCRDCGADITLIPTQCRSLNLPEHCPHMRAVHEEQQSEPHYLIEGRKVTEIVDTLSLLKKARDFLIRDLEEPGRTLFWQLVDAIKKIEEQNKLEHM